MADSHWDCLICGQSIDDAAGVSLDGTDEFHLCAACYSGIPPAVKLSECRAWRESRSRIDCMVAFERLCRDARGAGTVDFIRRSGGREPN